MTKFSHHIYHFCMNSLLHFGSLLCTFMDMSNHHSSLLTHCKFNTTLSVSKWKDSNRLLFCINAVCVIWLLHYETKRSDRFLLPPEPLLPKQVPGWITRPNFISIPRLNRYKYPSSVHHHALAFKVLITQRHLYTLVRMYKLDQSVVWQEQIMIACLPSTVVSYSWRWWSDPTST